MAAERIRLSFSSLNYFMSRLTLLMPDVEEFVSFVVLRGARLLERDSPETLMVETFADPPYGDNHNDLFLMSYIEDNCPRLDGVACTSHPARSYTMRPSKKAGAAILPLYTLLNYVRGKHKGRPAFNALNGINLVVRDFDKSGDISAVDKLDKGPFGVNIHPGNVSAGCVVISGGWHGDNWKQVSRWLEARQDSFPLMIIPGADMGVWENMNFIEQETIWRPGIALGSRHPWVTELQQLIYRQGVDITRDGVWGAETQKALEKVVGANAPARMGYELWRQLEGN